MKRLVFCLLPVLATSGDATAQVLNIPITAKVTRTVTVVSPNGVVTKTQSVERLYRSDDGSILHLTFVGGDDSGTPATGRLLDIANSRSYQINYVKQRFSASTTGPARDPGGLANPGLPTKVVNGVQCSVGGFAIDTAEPAPGDFVCRSDLYRLDIQTSVTVQDTRGATVTTVDELSDLVEDRARAASFFVVPPGFTEVPRSPGHLIVQ